MSRKKKRQKPSLRENYSTIPEHKHQGKKLIPPLRQIFEKEEPGSSWRNERLPEMLWAILLVTHLPREHALSVFRLVAKYIKELPKNDRFYDVTHTGLSKLPPDRLDDVLSIIIGGQEQRKALVPLLLLDELPCREIWAKALVVNRVYENWEPLMISVAKTLWHQTQESTDCRWLKVFCMLVAEKLFFGLEKREDSVQRVEEIYGYPSCSDPSRVAASIRANEIVLGGMNSNCSEWASKFWDECLTKTPCLLVNTNVTKAKLLVGTTMERLCEVYDLLIEHTHKSQTTSHVDARHDTVFGTGFYCLGLLQELLRLGNCHTISARASLRTISECYFTLVYLAKKDNTNLWLTHRVHGAGLTKLAFLKLDQSDDAPKYVDVQTLEQLANEDRWQELQDIDLSHWNQTDLRKMSEEVGVKDVYDQYYDWTSAFAHGSWGAIRDAVFDTCGNPLHRYHRVPRQSIRVLPDVVPDACQLVDKVLEIISQLYPRFPHRVLLENVNAP